ncbi:MAG: glycosyltransferase family 39 protein [Armatimonadota bacterium]|nr:glycosyltransferase family 39 protein [Armatimonadota bacterium]
MSETHVNTGKAAGSSGDRAARSFPFNRLNWIIICIGVLLRVAQYASNRSLWLDETLLAPSIVSRSYAGLLRPLDNYQAAPIPFLMAERFFVETFGSNEYALRLFPLVCGIAGLFLLYFVAKRVLRPEGVPVALGLFAISGPLIYFSSELKQYSSDVAVTLGLYAVAIILGKSSLSARKLFLFGALGAIAVWLSHPAVFVLAAVAVGWAHQCRREKQNWKLLVVALAFLLPVLSLTVEYFTVLRGPSQSPALLTGYRWMPFPPKSIKDIYWFVWNFFCCFTNPGGLRFTGLAAFCFLVGVWTFLRENRENAYMFLLPGLFALLASGVHKYPFFERLLLFLVPAMLLFLSQGAAVIKERLGGRGSAIWGLMITLIFLHPTFFALWHVVQPRTRNEVKPVLSYVQQHRQPGDLIYVDYASRPGFKYYAERFGFSDKDYVIGVMARPGHWEDYTNDFDKMRGSKRVWFVFLWANNWGGQPADEPGAWLYHLGLMGKRIDEFKGKGASTYLFDLSEEAARKAIPRGPEIPVEVPLYVD